MHRVHYLFSCLFLSLSICFSPVICAKSCRLQFQFTTVCFWLMHLCHESSPQSLSLFIQHSPLYSFFFFCVYTQECKSEDSLQGRGKGFSLSDPSLPFIPPFAQSFPSPPFPFCVSLLPPFLPLCSYKHTVSPSTYSFNFYWLFIGQLLQVHWNCKMRKALLR